MTFKDVLHNSFKKLVQTHILPSIRNEELSSDFFLNTVLRFLS